MTLTQQELTQMKLAGSLPNARCAEERFIHTRSKAVDFQPRLRWSVKVSASKQPERAAAETAFGDHDEDFETEFEINDHHAHLAEMRRYQYVLLRDDWQNLMLEF
jgi:hypothetical protein